MGRNRMTALQRQKNTKLNLFVCQQTQESNSVRVQLSPEGMCFEVCSTSMMILNQQVMLLVEEMGIWDHLGSF